MNKRITLKKNEDRRIKSGHLWIFSNEILNVEDGTGNGDIVDIYDFQNNMIGTGFYNKNSLIAARLLSRSQITDLKEFFHIKLTQAYKFRKELYPERESFRLIFSESDFLPGLIIDKYNSTFVLQIYSFGMEKNIELIVNVLKEEFSAKNIFTKNENHFRQLESLPLEDKVYLGDYSEEIINDGSLEFKINFKESHKTGFYFDQSDNRFFTEKVVRGKSVVDAFCNSGGFGLHALKAGASEVLFVDSSKNELKNVEENIKLNNLSASYKIIDKDVFDFLEEERNNNRKYDVVIIDPPAFAKNKKSLPQAIKGYEKLNRYAIQILNEGGYLVTSSCSFHLAEEEFISIISKAAAKTGKEVQLIHFNNASLDHPLLPSMRETVYLKFAVLKLK